MTTTPVIATRPTMIVEDIITVIIDTEARKDIIIVDFIGMATTGTMITIHTAEIPDPTDIASRCT